MTPKIKKALEEYIKERVEEEMEDYPISVYLDNERVDIIKEDREDGEIRLYVERKNDGY